MAQLTTGFIKNPVVSGVRPSSTLLVRISNPDSVSATIRINGFYWAGTTKTEYVLDVLTLAPKEVGDWNYFAQFDAYEFQFITNSDSVEVSVWGKNAAGDRAFVHTMLPAELLPLDMDGRARTSGPTIPSALDQVYVLNSSNNTVSVIDGKTNTFLGNVIVGSGPYGIAVNPTTNRIYVVNFGDHTVSVIDGKSNAVITTITVGANPVGVGINLTTNRIYVTNWGSNSVSVIDGFTHVVIATITVGTSPEGVNVNPTTNQIYITNHGSNNVSVINGRTNSIVTTVAVGVTIL